MNSIKKLVKRSPSYYCKFPGCSEKGDGNDLLRGSVKKAQFSHRVDLELMG